MGRADARRGTFAHSLAHSFTHSNNQTIDRSIDQGDLATCCTVGTRLGRCEPCSSRFCPSGRPAGATEDGHRLTSEADSTGQWRPGARGAARRCRAAAARRPQRRRRRRRRRCRTASWSSAGARPCRRPGCSLWREPAVVARPRSCDALSGPAPAPRHVSAHLRRSSTTTSARQAFQPPNM